MQLSHTRQTWEEFARIDPYWAVLTDQSKQHGGWDPEDFMRTGRVTVEHDLARIRRLRPEFRQATALDFGCGVGRLTQALAEHFAQVTGVDISEGMIAHARRLNRHGGSVAYLVNTRSDLRLLEDGQFDLVYSFITLQHIPPASARRYIREFVRVTAPGGVICFQLPSYVHRVRAGLRPFTLWPDTLLKRLYRDWRTWRGDRRLMAMHAIPKEEVVTLLESAGAQVIEIYPYEVTGVENVSWGYIAQKC
jgi:SAM-dependent methyltransferase